MRLIVARRMSLRGEGLGNELLPWAKGWIASQELDAHLVGPSWGLNRRRYFRHFQTSRLDFVLEDTLLKLPHSRFSEDEYRATGEIDFGAAISKWADQRGLRAKKGFVLRVDGMWGGYRCIRRARPFLWSKLLASSDALGNIDRIMSRIDRSKIFAAVHMRAGQDGFSPAMERGERRGRFNVATQAEWYEWVCEELRRSFGGRIQFWFFTDRRGPEFEKAVHRFNPGQIEMPGLTECSDLALMAMADVRVCSVSSYSMTACYLADGPYIWYEPHLQLHNGLYSMWGHEEAQQAADSLTKQSARFVADLNAKDPPVNFAGAAMDVGDPLPDHLAAMLDQRLCGKDARTNLLEYGCLPQGPHTRRAIEEG